MNQYLITVIKRYLFFCLSLSFFCIVLSPYFQKANAHEVIKISLSLFFYRIHIISIFSLLFASLTSIQFFEKQNVSIALSMSGTHSFKIMQPVIFFSAFLCTSILIFNQFFLSDAIKVLKKESFFSTYNNNLSVLHLKEGTIFFTKNNKHFLYINNNNDLLYAKHHILTDDGFQLAYMDLFQKNNNIYEKINSKTSYLLKVDTSNITTPSSIKTSDSMTTLFHTLINNNEKSQINLPKLQVTLFYRLIMPLLHFFSISLAMLFGFSSFFRKRNYLAIFCCIVSSMFFFYLLECSAILAEGNIISPLYFIIMGFTLSFITPIFSYLKKV